jgi:GNAT superfamily N-acetyltransferase
MLQLKLIEKLAEKQKWQQRFCDSYRGGLRPVTNAVFGPTVRFYVAIDDDKELGFMRINDKSAFYKDRPDMEVWSISDAYVKPKYRGNGVLREMIAQAVRDLNVRMFYIETERFKAYRAYYSTLGFTYSYTVDEGSMTWAFLGSFMQAVKASNDAYYRKVA